MPASGDVADLVLRVHRSKPIALLILLGLLLVMPTRGLDTIVMGFFGQNPQAESSLASMCNRGFYNMIAVSFVNTYGYRPLHVDLGQYNCDVPVGQGLSNSGCATIAQDIQYCRSLGITMLLAMGGCVDTGCGGDYYFQSAQQANDTAVAVWQTYLAPVAANSSTAVAGSTSRPFGNATFDGVALDVENNNGTYPDQPFYDMFVTILHSFQSNLLIVGTPECRINRTDRNPMETMVTNVPFDYLMIQFYNDQQCSFGQSQFGSTLQTWMQLQNSAKDTMELLIGAPGDAASYDKNSGSKLLSGGQLGALVNQYRNDTVRNRVVGVGLWAAQNDTRMFNALSNKLSTPWDTSGSLTRVQFPSTSLKFSSVVAMTACFFMAPFI